MHVICNIHSMGVTGEGIQYIIDKFSLSELLQYSIQIQISNTDTKKKSLIPERRKFLSLEPLSSVVPPSDAAAPPDFRFQTSQSQLTST